MADQQLNSLTAATTITAGDLTYVMASPFGAGTDRSVTMGDLQTYFQGTLL